MPALATMLLSCMVPVVISAQQPASTGLKVIREKPFIPADFDEDTFAALWTVWPEPERSEAARATAEDRRQLTFSYYGLMPAPAGLPGEIPALGYTRQGDGGWAMNCLACHGGQVAGQVIPGLPNSHFALQTLIEDVRLVKLQQKKKLTHLDLASLSLPLSTTNGTSNAVVFGIVLGALRKPDMSVDTTQKMPELLHHDVDAPPFWNVKYKSSLYADGFAPKTHRPLMQFMLLPSNSKETVYGWEQDFHEIQAWIESVEAPKYPGTIDEELRRKGQTVFEFHCMECHGRYDPQVVYDQKLVNWEVVRTDRARLDSLSPAHREWMKRGWMSRYGRDHVDIAPQGYVAPPLTGIWASAPYFHNGSVPTLWHVLNPPERPIVWKRTENGYDHNRMGLEVHAFEEIPATVTHPAHRRTYFDTRQFGKGASGHDFAEPLSDDEKTQLLEYLKSL